MRYQHAPSGSRVQRPGSSTPIHLLDDDVLLIIFDIYQEDISTAYNDILLEPNWDSARWWYKLAQVCRRWRYLILSSPVRLGLHLVCTYGTPVAEMLAHSPPLPLILNFLDKVCEPNAEDEQAILLALQHRDRVRRIGLRMSAPKLSKHILAISEQFPVLESLFIWPLSGDNTNLMLPATFQAPHLRVLLLSYVSLPLGSPLLSTATGLTALEFKDILPSAHFPPSYLVARLSSLPQLECLSIGFKFADTTRAIESHPSHLVGPLVTLPSLRLCFFEGIGTYLEGFLARIRTPLLESLRIRLFNQLTFSFPHLLRLINTTENFRFSSAQLFFFQGLVGLTADRPEGDIQIIVGCRHIDWQVSAATQIFSALVPALSVVERLVLHYEEHDLPSEWDDDVRRTGWRDLLTPFTSVKDLHVDGGLIQELSRSLRTEGEESSLGLLPELKELIYYKDGDPSEDPSEAFASFINARQIEGHPVTVIPHPPSSFSFI